MGQALKALVQGGELSGEQVAFIRMITHQGKGRADSSMDRAVMYSWGLEEKGGRKLRFGSVEALGNHSLRGDEGKAQRNVRPTPGRVI